MENKCLKLVTNLGVAALCVFYLIWSVYPIATDSQKYQWDFKTYYYASVAYRQGKNPYDTHTISEIAGEKLFSFAYPPFTLLFFQIFGLFEYHTAHYLYLILKLVMISATVLIWFRIMKKPDLHFLLFALIGFNSAVLHDLAAGNISVIEQFLIWLGIYFLLEKKIKIFSLFVIAASIFKITPIFLLALALFQDTKNRVKTFLLALAFFLLIFLCAYFVMPAEFSNYFGNLAGLSELGVSSMSVIKAVAIFTELIFGIHVRQHIITILFVPVAVILLVVLLKFILVIRTQKNESRLAVIFFSILTYALILPRFKEYGYILLIPSVYFIFKKFGKERLLIIASFIIYCLPVFGLGNYRIPYLMFYHYGPLIISYIAWLLYIIKYKVISKTK